MNEYMYIIQDSLEKVMRERDELRKERDRFRQTIEDIKVRLSIL